jgi:hypothetical protein
LFVIIFILRLIVLISPPSLENSENQNKYNYLFQCPCVNRKKNRSGTNPQNPARRSGKVDPAIF